MFFSNAESLVHEDLTPSAAITSHATPVEHQCPEKTLLLPRTPRYQPRRFKGSCDYEVSVLQVPLLQLSLT